MQRTQNAKVLVLNNTINNLDIYLAISIPVTSFWNDKTSQNQIYLMFSVIFANNQLPRPDNMLHWQARSAVSHSRKTIRSILNYKRINLSFKDLKGCVKLKQDFKRTSSTSTRSLKTFKMLQSKEFWGSSLSLKLSQLKCI